LTLLPYTTLFRADIGSAFAGALDRSGLEGRRRVLADIQEVVATQVLVALGMVGIEARRLERHLDLAGFRLRRVEAEAPLEILEGSPQPAIAQVAGLEIDEGMLALLVDDVVGSHGLTGKEHR